MSLFGVALMYELPNLNLINCYPCVILKCSYNLSEVYQAFI